jgi:nucleolar protein 56
MGSNQLFLLFETSSGYSLFERLEIEEITEQNEQLQQSIQDSSKFKKIVKFTSFYPFKTAENALENINDISEGVLSEDLKNFLQNSLPKVKTGKKSKYILGVSEDKLGSAIQEELGINCQKSTLILELLRGIRLHFTHFVKELKESDLIKSQLGLARSYSRAKVKFNIHRVDNMIIQSISLLDQLDKDLNTFSMRCREWYSWHFPELTKIISDHATYAQLVKFIRDKSKLTDEYLPNLEEITKDSAKAQEILDAAKSSMGTDISDIDMINIEHFADRVIELSKYRQKLHSYLLKKMHDVAPNLSALIGEQVGARLISHAGSLTNLAKYPASTIQILGAEKALFRALKTRGKTPKYGLIFHSSFIGRANPKNKGRISRYLANKCSIAARIDSFSEFSTSLFGEKLKEQVEERLKFYDSGIKPRKNLDVMKEVLEEVNKEVSHNVDEQNQKRKKRMAEDKIEIETPKKKKKEKEKKN